MVVQFKLAFTAKFGFKTLIPQDIAKNSISGTLFKNISGLSGGVMEISEYKSTRVTDTSTSFGKPKIVQLFVEERVISRPVTNPILQVNIPS